MSRLWYTRCPAPTPFGIAAQKGWRTSVVDFHRATALRGFSSSLAALGVQLEDIDLVDLPHTPRSLEDAKPAGDAPLADRLDAQRPHEFAREAEALLRGEADVVFVKGATGLDIANLLNAKILVDIGAQPNRALHANNGTPRPLTVDAQLLGERPDFVERVLARTLDTGECAEHHPADVAHYVARETRSAEHWVDVYGKGESEQVVGRSIAAQRERWVLATKFANPLQDGDVNARGASRKHIVRAVDASLKRLNTDYIDLLYIHREDHETPVEETVRALNDLIRAGKLRYYGLSNHRAWKIAEFSHTAQALGLDAPVASQPLYNIANRQAEAEQLTAAHRYGLGVISYSPLARGVLTGKYEPGATPGADTRAGRSDRRLQQTEWRPESLELARRVREHAQARGLSAGQFALAWVLNSRYISSTIGGPRTEAQWQDYLPALRYRLTAEDEVFVDSLVTSGHPSTPGFNDPGHPFFGRIARHGTSQDRQAPVRQG
jgi:aryl-alcohol dehydrogenase-like predicted oxidoreductase